MTAKNFKKGIFITFEGGEGSGKSTHSQRLFRELITKGYDAVHTMEPGGTPLGRKIRDMLLQKDYIRLDKEAELFLFEADRSQHVEEVIKPALEKKRIVICDRFNAATFAYQGHGLGMDINLIKRVDDIARGSVKPDLILLLDLDIKTGLERASIKNRADRMEKRAVEFHKRVRKGYLALAKKDPARFKIIKVEGSLDEVYGEIREKVYAVIERYKRAG